METLSLFLQDMQQKYPDGVVRENTCPDASLENIPLPLKEFYRQYDSIEFPFGHILPREVAVRNDAEKAYFDRMGWFSFGGDYYFSFWLCRYAPDDEGLWLTSWDHDVDDEIEGMYADLVAFLKAMEETYAEMEQQM